MKPSIYLKGMDELERKCNQIIKKVDKEKKAILLKPARFIRDGIKQNIKSRFDKKTGNLLGSPYAVAYAPTASNPAVAFAGIRPKRAPHAHLLEHGTSKMAAKPFVRPAISQRKGPAMDMIRASLKKTVKGAA